MFGVVAIIASVSFLLLPETLNKELPQTLEDGEKYGKGDTAFRTCFTSNNKPTSNRNKDMKQNSDGAEQMLV